MTRTKLRTSLVERAARVVEWPTWPSADLCPGDEVRVLVNGKLLCSTTVTDECSVRLWIKRPGQSEHEEAARVAEKRACLVCAASGDKIPGHEACAAFVEIAREIRKLGMEVKL